MDRVQNHFHHHWHFYAAAIVGGLIFLWPGLNGPPRTLAAGDAFFFVYLVIAAAAVYRLDVEGLRKKAASEDEGILVVILIALVVIGISSLAIITVLREKHAPSPLAMTLALGGAPLGWTALHTIAAFHYANLFYTQSGRAKTAHDTRGLEFADTKEPGIWEFLYFAFTIGMTAQTSDTEVSDTRMRRAVLAHSVVSFFYNTAIIAMAVNAVVSTAS
ncbi:MAG: DUF1345 domain-containing protein [Rhizomicrobium sp.]